MVQSQTEKIQIPPQVDRLLSAKTRVPRPGDRISRRKRLAEDLDRLLARGHAWIYGPPGIGKTVLAAEYANQSTLPVAWYELDELDTEPVSFFSCFPKAFLSLLENPSVALQSLPQLLPENQLGLSLFARKFFRTLFGRLSSPWLLVLDNCQEIPPDSPLVELLMLCLRELPVDCRALLLSRRPPPPCFARMKTEGRLQVMAPEALQFSSREIAEVLTLYGITREQENCVQYLQQTTAGWAAGITLLLREQNRRSCIHDQVEDLDYQELFDYFAGVVFTGLDRDKKELLMEAALLPEIRPQVLDRFNNSRPGGAGRYFLELSRNNYFTYRLDNQGKLFQFHPLFREFLRNRAAESFSPDHWRTIHERIADELVAEHRFAEGVELLNQGGIWHKSVELIRQGGRELLRQGRFKTLLRWHEVLPSRWVDDDPYLLYLFGNATIAFNPKAAREVLVRSFQLFRDLNDRTGCLLACAALTNSISNFLSDLKALDPWLDYMEEELDPGQCSEEGSFEQVTIVNAIFRAMVLRRPDHPDLEAWREQVIALGTIPPSLITHYLWTGRFVEARSALDRVYADREKISSRLQLSAIQAMEVQYYLIMGDVDGCNRVIAEALQMMEETGIRVWEIHFLILGAGCSLNCGRIKAAARYLEDVEKNIGRARLLERSYYHVVKVLQALLADDLAAADHHQQTALDMALDIGMPSYTMWCWYGAALVAVFQGNTLVAQSRFDRLLALAGAPDNPWFTCQAELGLGWMHLKAGQRDQAVTHLSRGFTLAREHGYLSFFYFLPRMMSELAVLALEEGIEAGFTVRLIRRHHLSPDSPPLHLDQWPWPLKIYTLGRFAIIRDGKKLDPSVRSQNKPLLLLQALLALGGREVSKHLLTEIFWPQSNGDEQMAALKITLYRLRKLLQVKDAVLQTPRALTINPRVCWVDSWQFERMANRALSGEVSDAEDAARATREALAAYGGDFLPACANESWSFAGRDHLRRLYHRLSAGK